jgi:hypothetical protein
LSPFCETLKSSFSSSLEILSLSLDFSKADQISESEYNPTGSRLNLKVILSKNNFFLSFNY